MKALIALVSLMFGLSAVAATPTTSVKTSAPAQEDRIPMLKGRSLVMHYSNASNVDFKSGGTTGRFNGENALGLGLRFGRPMVGELTVSMALGLEMPRKFSSITVDGRNTNVQADRVGFLWLEPGLNYAWNSQVYVTGGLNYLQPTTSNLLGAEIKPAFGWQAGAGYNVDSKWTIEGLYRTAHFRGNVPAQPGQSGVDFDKIALEGLLFRLNYHTN